MATEISLSNLIKKINKFPNSLKKGVLLDCAEASLSLTQDRVLNRGINVKGKKMEYAKSTKAFKIKTGRNPNKKVMAHSENRIWSSHQIVSKSKDKIVVGWRVGSEGHRLAQINQKRDYFHGLSRSEEKKVFSIAEKKINKNFKDIFK